MSAADLAEVMKGIGRLERRLDELEQTVIDVPKQERLDLERLIDGLVAAQKQRVADEKSKEAADELAAQRASRPRK